MRILFLHHAVLDAIPSAENCRQKVAALRSQGHEAEILSLGKPEQSEPGMRLVASPVGEIPRFAVQSNCQLAFAALSDVQIASYRDQLRDELDRSVVAFDPQVMHVEHIWFWGQLALETGVPYLLSAWTEELAEIERNPSLKSYVDQGAENASAILIDSPTTAEKVRETFRPLETRFTLRTLDPSSLGLLYQAILEQRFGKASS